MGRDPDIRTTGSGATVANVGLATSEKWVDKSTGEKKEETEWHRLVFFGKTAEVVEKYLKKGSKILVEGRLKTNKWTDAQGVEKYTTEVIVSKLVMVGGNQGSGQDSGHSPRTAPATQVLAHEDFDEDLPF